MRRKPYVRERAPRSSPSYLLQCRRPLTALTVSEDVSDRPARSSARCGFGPPSTAVSERALARKASGHPLPQVDKWGRVYVPYRLVEKRTWPQSTIIPDDNTGSTTGAFRFSPECYAQIGVRKHPTAYNRFDAADGPRHQRPIGSGTSTLTRAFELADVAFGDTQ
jgi:hypothetical protein